MLILLEGADGSGKTTLCKQLKEFGFNVEPTVSRSETNQYEQWIKLINKGDAIIDRSFITDLVYRSVDDEKAGNITLEQMCYLLKYCKIILCDTDSAFEDSMKRGENNITDKETATKIKDAYKLILTMLGKFTKAEVFTYNWKKQKFNEVIKFII